MDALMTTSHRFLDIILLVPLPINLINRDDMNRPKTSVFGNVPRLSSSAQNFKVGYRRGSRYGKHLLRSKWLPGLIVEKVFGKLPDDPSEGEMALYEAVRDALFDNTKKKDADAEKAKKQADAKAKKAAKADPTAAAPVATAAPAKKGRKDLLATEALILVSQDEVDNLVTEVTPILKATPLDKDALQEAVKRAFVNSRRTDQALARALLGRMVTNSDIDEHRDGAMQLSWPFSVERARIMTDYVGAQDDISRNYVDEPGAGHITERPFSGGCTMLIHYQVDVDLLASNAKFDTLEQALQTHKDVIVDILLDVVETTTFRPFAGAAAQGSYRTSPRASLAVARISREGCLYDAAPAFELPVLPTEDSPPSRVAARRLLAYLERSNKSFGAPLASVVFSADPEVAGDVSTRDDFLAAVKGLIEKVLA